DFVHLAGHGNALFDVFEADATGVFRNDGSRQRIPVCQPLAGLDGIAITDINGRTVGDLVTFAFALAFIKDNDFTGTRNGHTLVLAVGDIAQAQFEADRTGDLALDGAGHGGTRCGPTNMEGTHGELGTRLTNGLGSNDPHGFTAVDLGAPAQIATIATCAQT